MNRTTTYGAVAFSVLAVGATVDSALGLGGGAFLADICRTILDGDRVVDGGGVPMDMTVKPLPLIGLSLGVTGLAAAVLTLEQRRASTGGAAPDHAETAAIISAMIAIAAAENRVNRGELSDVFRIVTGQELEDAFLDLAVERCRALAGTDPDAIRFPPVATAIGRRRVLAAALMVGCVGKQCPPRVSALIERLTIDIGATGEDITAARTALDRWTEGCEGRRSLSLITLLRHRRLELRPA